MKLDYIHTEENLVCVPDSPDHYRHLMSMLQKHLTLQLSLLMQVKNGFWCVFGEIFSRIINFLKFCL